MLTRAALILPLVLCLLLNGLQSAWASVHHGLGAAVAVLETSAPCHEPAATAGEQDAAQQAAECCEGGVCFCSCASSAMAFTGFSVQALQPQPLPAPLALELPQGLIYELLRPPLHS